MLVKVAFSGLCGSQIGEIRGVKGPDRFLPHLLGHEGGGVVLEVGDGVSHVRPDDRVVLHWRPGAGFPGKTPKYYWGKKIVNAGYVTTLNQYAIVSENRLTKIPSSYPLDKASLYGCAVTTGLGVIENNANLKMGQTILVVGAGGVGLNIIQGAALHSAHRIVAVDLFQNRLELAKLFGATDTILSTSRESDWTDEAHDLSNGGGFDYVVDNTGNHEVIEKCYSLTKATGRTVLVGVPALGSRTKINTLPLHFGKSICGSHGGDGDPAIDIPRYMRLEDRGILNLDKFFSHKFELSEVNEAVRCMEDGSLTGRALIDCS